MLHIDLKGKTAFVAGIGDDQGYGWAIAKALAEAGARVLVGTWVPLVKILSTGLKSGKFDASRQLSDGRVLDFAKIYPIDCCYDTPDDVPEELRENKRYKGVQGYTVSEVAQAVEIDYGSIDILVHSLANAPEVKHSLLQTSRKGYLEALSASSYSLISLLKYFGPLMNPGGSVISLSYLAAERAVPGYGGGMSSAKAALESDTRTLAWEAGRAWNIRVNTISAGVLASRAARAIGFAEKMLQYQTKNAPLSKELLSDEVAYGAAFLCSPLASAITGTTLYVDNGMHSMGVCVEAPSLQDGQTSTESQTIKNL